MLRSLMSLFAGAAIVATTATGAAAQAPAWPTRPIKLMVPAPAGTGADLVGRVLAESLTKSLGQPVIVDNKAGANGIIGAELVAKAPPDGYTLLLSYAGAHTVNQHIAARIPYDVRRDFAGIAQVGATGTMLVVRADMGIQDLQGFIAWARSRPADSVTYGSWGVGSGGHLNMEVLAQQAKLQLRHVPYKAAPEAVMDLMAGRIDASFAVTTSVLSHVQSGKLKPLAISGTRRSPVLPDVKTMSEQGIKLDLMAWYAVFAPAGTPTSIVDTLNREINKIVAAPEQAERWRQLGFVEMPVRSPGQVNDLVTKDLREWGAVVKAANIRAE